MQPTLSTKALIKSTTIALIIAALALITIILPAEYNTDPTGIGAQLGLTALAQSTAKDAIKTGFKQSSDSFEVIVPAGRGVEFKFAMAQFKKMEYSWKTDGELLFFDLHGEPEGDTTGYYESYAIATLDGMKGSYTTPFAGVHGWYWKNKSDKAITVQLTVSGEYTVIGLKK